MSAIENIEVTPSPKLRKPQQLTSGMDFSQFFNSEMLTTANLSQLSDLAPPREAPSKQTDVMRQPDKQITKHETERSDPPAYSEEDSTVEAYKPSDIGSSPVEDIKSNVDYEREKLSHNNNSNTSMNADDHANTGISTEADADELTDASSNRAISNNKDVPQAGVEEYRDGATPDIQKIASVIQKPANVVTSDTAKTLSHPASLSSQIENESKISEALNSVIKPTLPATDNDTATVSAPNNVEVSIPQKVGNSATFESELVPISPKPEETKSSNVVGQSNVNTTIAREKSDIITGSNNKALLEPQFLDITKPVSTDTKIAQKPILNNDSDKLASPLNQSGLTTNNQTNVANVINQPQSSGLNDKDLLLSSAPKLQEVNKPQTDIERTTGRENINPTLKNENKIPGLKLSPLEGDVSIRVVDNNTAPRVYNAAGNNILQAQNGAQTGDNNAALANRGVSAQSLHLPQHQVETGQSNQQISNAKPLHVGANTGENNSGFTQNSSQGNASSIASNTANQPGVTPINGLETFKQHALKSDGSTNQHAATRKIGSASLGTQTNQPAAPNALAGVNASSPQTANSVLSAQQPVTNPKSGGAPAATNQVSVQLSKAIQNGDNKIKIQLRPQELGRVEVKLEIANDGRAKAMIIAERSETLDILQRDVRVLERALQDAGLKTDQNSLSFDLHGRKDNSDTRQADLQNSNDGTDPDTSNGSNILENESNPISATAIGITPDGSINLLT
ncbi:MAG: flagellar hook-length control protein FliK [Thalassobaculaceae bacterium]